jgi:hypothetical protein
MSLGISFDFGKNDLGGRKFGKAGRSTGHAAGILPVSGKNYSGTKTPAELPPGYFQHFIVPMFERMYSGLGDELFWMTRLLVDFSDSLRINPAKWVMINSFLSK